MTTIVTTTSTSNGVTGGLSKPFVRIVEQPAKCAIRFRYECEGRSAGSIPGINATPENKTFPTIQVCNFRGKAVVVVSCVTKEPPFRPHPHNLVGKEGCKKGVCTLVIDNNPDMTCTFTSLGIQCVKRNKIEESLKLRETIKVDPFRTGFSHRTQASSIDLNCLRLCFQVFIEQGPEKGKFTVLPPVVSDAIYDKKAMAELIIVKLSHYSAPCTGGKEIILLCDRVAKDDIQVRFIQESNTQGILWEGFGEFTANDVHKQVAISLRTPKYFDESISQPITVQIQLRRPSDGCLSLPRSFQITPRELDPDGLVRKRHKRLKEENYNLLQEYIQLASGQTSNSGQQGIVVQPQPSCSSKLLPSPVTTSTGVGGVTIKTELPSAPVVTAVVSSPRTFATTADTQQFQQQQQQQQQQYIQPQSQHSSPPQHIMSDSASMSPGQPQYLYQNNGNTTNNNNEDSNAPSQYTSLYDHHHAHNQASPQHQSTSSTPSSMAYALAAAMAASSSASSTSPSTQPMMIGGGNGNVTIGSPTNHHAQHHAHFQQQQPSPCPSQGSYPSPIHSPATNTNNNNNVNNSLHNNNNNNNAGNNQNPVRQQQHQEIPNEVMERFDSLDIDSSELIPDLDFNSNTMLSLMMDTSSGLSLTDSFNDMANNNSQQPQSVQMNGTSSLNDNESNIIPNRTNPYILGLANSRARLKLNLQTSTLHNSNSNHPDNNSNATTLDTPLIEMLNNNGIAGGTYDNLNNNNSSNVAGTNHQPMFSALDLDNNNINLN